MKTQTIGGISLAILSFACIPLTAISHPILIVVSLICFLLSNLVLTFKY
jgi:hypothetical protein